MSRSRALLLVGFAYVWWGLSAIFWRQLDSVAPVDQLSFRVVSAIITLGLVALARGGFTLRALSVRHWHFGVAAAALIAANWGVFLWAVANEQAVEAALGYFLMPVVAVALGVVGLGERPSADQRVALALAAVGLLWTFVVVGGVPWVALVLGVSFASYGWVRKVGPWESVEGLTFEVVLIAPILVVVLVSRSLDGVAVTGDGAAGTLVFLALTGVVTAVPLVLFAAAAKQASLTMVGLLQYINPTLQFIVGWKVFGEEVPLGRWLGFAWIWAALAVVVRAELRGASRPVAVRRR